MHELSIVQSLLDRVQLEAEQRGAVSVKRLQVRIGELSGVEIDLLRSAFSLFERDPLVGEAELVVERVPARWSCPRCGADVGANGPPRCTTCDGPARLCAGDEIILERIEMEVT